MKFIILMILCLINIPDSLSASLYIVGNKSSFHQSIKIGEIRSIYLLKLKTNKTGQKLLPINLPPNSHIRDIFSQAVFNKRATALADYWNRIAFRGVNPPLIQSSEKSVLIFVSHVKGAIGYVTTKPDSSQVTTLLKIRFKAKQLNSLNIHTAESN